MGLLKVNLSRQKGSRAWFGSSQALAVQRRITHLRLPLPSCALSHLAQRNDQGNQPICLHLLWPRRQLAVLADCAWHQAVCHAGGTCHPRLDAALHRSWAHLQAFKHEIRKRVLQGVVLQQW